MLPGQKGMHSCQSKTLHLAPNLACMPHCAPQLGEPYGLHIISEQLASSYSWEHSQTKEPSTPLNQDKQSACFSTGGFHHKA